MSGNFGTNDKILAVVLCYSESELNNRAVHQGNYIGICGVNPKIWKHYLKEQNIHYNSIQGGFEVYKFYLEQTNSEYNALLKYKGVKNKKANRTVNKILYVKNKLKVKLDNTKNK